MSPEPRETLARFLEFIGLVPIILHEQASKGMTIPEKLTAYSSVGFAVVLLTPDDVGRAKKDTDDKDRARQNVILELGYFVGRLGRSRVCALRKGDVEIPSDYLGVVYTELDAAGGWKQSLAQELEAAGYDIDWNKVMRRGA
ncbi:nucleotide-binding protein [Brevundimonas sp.]|uniref:nucleotide-binding protein n=1 Tax=Brevundimonas sp. TaxID=1871086 RepID=UPI0025B9986D|nr:nucleotide-binding protein [Brevundimonas sp.]